jgi:hypothetical protein
MSENNDAPPIYGEAKPMMGLKHIGHLMEMSLPFLAGNPIGDVLAEVIFSGGRLNDKRLDEQHTDEN